MAAGAVGGWGGVAVWVCMESDDDVILDLRKDVTAIPSRRVPHTPHTPHMTQ